jgi:hypothetical protein
MYLIILVLLIIIIYWLIQNTAKYTEYFDVSDETPDYLTGLSKQIPDGLKLIGTEKETTVDSVKEICSMNNMCNVIEYIPQTEENGIANLYHDPNKLARDPESKSLKASQYINFIFSKTKKKLRTSQVAKAEHDAIVAVQQKKLEEIKRVEEEKRVEEMKRIEALRPKDRHTLTFGIQVDNQFNFQYIPNVDRSQYDEVYRIRGHESLQNLITEWTRYNEFTIDNVKEGDRVYFNVNNTGGVAGMILWWEYNGQRFNSDRYTVKFVNGETREAPMNHWSGYQHPSLNNAKWVWIRRDGNEHDRGFFDAGLWWADQWQQAYITMPRPLKRYPLEIGIQVDDQFTYQYIPNVSIYESEFTYKIQMDINNPIIGWTRFNNITIPDVLEGDRVYFNVNNTGGPGGMALWWKYNGKTYYSNKNTVKFVSGDTMETPTNYWAGGQDASLSNAKWIWVQRNGNEHDRGFQRDGIWWADQWQQAYITMEVE